MYRKTKRSAETIARMNSARSLRRMSAPAPDYPAPIPELRRQIIIRDFDFGERTHTIDLYRTNRIDCYRVVVDGTPWKVRMGWSRILAALRKSLPRVGAE